MFWVHTGAKIQPYDADIDKVATNNQKPTSLCLDTKSVLVNSLLILSNNGAGTI